MWWRKPKKPEKSRREELLETREKLKDQIALLKMVPPPQRPPYVNQSTQTIARLSEVLAAIESELADEQPRRQ
jgi:hypothetical protein